jgi:hypothetical protein
VTRPTADGKRPVSARTERSAGRVWIAGSKTGDEVVIEGANPDRRKASKIGMDMTGAGRLRN